MKTLFRLLLLASALCAVARAQTVAITAPTDPVTAPITIAGTTTGAVNNVLLTANGTTVGSGTVATNAWSVLWSPTTVGTYTLRAQGRDSTNANVGAAVTLDVTITGVAPGSVTLAMTPSGTSVPSGSSRFFTATATDDGAIDRVEFYVDGDLAGTDTTSPYNFLFTASSTTGLHTIFARAIDNAGLGTNSATTTIEVPAPIGNAPTVGISSPFSGTYLPVNAASIITGTAVDTDGTILASGITVYVNGVTGTAAGLGNVTYSNGTWSVPWTPNAIGPATLTAFAADDKANTIASPDLMVNVTDASSPTISLTLTPGTSNPQPGTNSIPVLSIRNVVANASSPSGRAIVRVEFFLDGTKIGEDSSAPYTFRFTAPPTTGTYVLSARATDSSGLARDAQINITTTAAVGLPPNITLLTPIAGTVVTPNTGVSLAAAATSSSGTIASVQFYVNGNTTNLGASNGLVTTAPFVATFTPTLAGSYVIDAIATDDRGNSRLSSSVVVNAAFLAPTISISSPKPDPSNPNGPVRITPNVPTTISATAQGGSGAAILLVEFLVDSTVIGVRQTPTTTGGTTYSLSWTPTTAQLGLHALTARVTDVNSQTATSNAINVNVANIVGTPPSVTITAPTGAAASAIQSLSTVNFIANAFATPTTNSITGVEFFVNDVSVGAATREQTTNLWRLAYTFAGYDFSAITPDGNGRYPVSLYAIAKDANGNQTISTTVALLVTPSISAPPSVTLQPLLIGLPGQTTNTVAQGTAFPMVALVNDTDGTVASIQLFVNGAANGAVINSPAPQQPITYNATAAGRFNLFAVVTDDTGNTTVSTPAIVLNVNAIAAPVTSVQRPMDDSTVTTVNTPVFLEATASSSDPTQVLTVSFTAVGTGGARASITNVQRVGTTNTYRAIWTPTVADTYTLTSTAAIGTTVSSNSGNSRRVTVTQIQGIAPVVSINVPGTVTTASTANFTATATDSDGSVVSVEFFLNRNSIGFAERDQLTNTWRMTARFAGITPATGNEVVALARDTSGNVAASGTSTINITAASSIAPTVAITSSNLNPAFSRTVQLTANARDTDGTVASVQYFQNGSNIATSFTAGTNFQVNWTPNQAGTFNVWAVATDNSGITTVAPTIQVTVRRNAPVTEDAAFILQTSQDIANTTNINPLVFENLNAQFDAGTLTRAAYATSLTTDPAFVPPVNLLAAYYVIMGQWPTPVNYTTLLTTARGNFGNAITAILNSNEYFAKFGVVPTVALLNNANSAIPARTFLTRLHANAGLPAPSDTDLIRFMNNDTTFGGTLMRGYNVVGLPTTLTEFVTNVNASNAALMKKAQAAALYYQLDRPPITVTTDQIAARVTQLAALPDMTAMADAVLNDVLYTYRFVTILQDPVSAVVAPRSGIILSVDAIGQPPLSYQWLLNGAPLANATGSTLVINNVGTANVGNYTVAITSAQASATSNAATITLSNTPTRLGNISTRGPTGANANVLIGGFVVTGPANQTRQMLIRVAGPAIAVAPFNVPGTLADPRLEVYGTNSTTPLLTNDNWGTQAGGAGAVTTIQQAATRVGAFPFAAGSADAAVIANLPPGAYTVQAKGPTLTSAGVVLIEVYDVTQGAPAGPKAANVSTRGNVGTGDNILIAGFNVTGGVSRRLLIRGVGPTIADPRFALPAGSTLSDPQLTLINQATGAIVKTSDDWTSDPTMAPLIAAAATAGGAFPLQNGSKDAAMLVMLAPGTYTVKLNGAGTATGIGIVEVYDVDP